MPARPLPKVSKFAIECLAETAYQIVPFYQEDTYAGRRFTESRPGTKCYEYTVNKQSGVTAEELVLMAVYLDLENDASPSPLLGLTV